nr:uncharacterized protein LOC112545631 [Pelodiscus sinensis]|eukprot:XP_025039964.1 uncharacterized protein LOC112545631 [Pelodiscus sinensis]
MLGSGARAGQRHEERMLFPLQHPHSVPQQDAMKLPKNTPEEREKRTAAMQQGLKRAVDVPFALAEKVTALWPTLREMARYGNLACKSDLQVLAVALAEECSTGCQRCRSGLGLLLHLGRSLRPMVSELAADFSCLNCRRILPGHRPLCLGFLVCGVGRDASLPRRSTGEKGHLLGRGGVFGASFNVVTNLKDVADEAFREEVGRPSAMPQALAGDTRP